MLPLLVTKQTGNAMRGWDRHVYCRLAQHWLYFTALLVILHRTTGTCEKGNCPEDHASAKANGLLGASVPCDQKVYPRAGKLKPVCGVQKR